PVSSRAHCASTSTTSTFFVRAPMCAWLKSRCDSPQRQEGIMIEGMTRTWLRRCGGLGAMTATAMALAAFAPAAHAAQAAWMAEVDEDAEIVDGGGTPDGQRDWSRNYSFSGAGTLTVQAYDLGVPNTLMERLDSLSFSVAKSSTILGSHLGDGSMSFNLNGPGDFLVNFSATPSAAARFGVPLVSWRVSFSPAAAPTVPLPAS